MATDTESVVRPELTVAAVIEDDGRFLFVEELVRGRKVINQPAGHVETGESLVEAVIRETLEETAWTFDPEAITGIYLWSPPQGGSTFLRVAFAGRGLHHDPARPLDEGIVRPLWLSRAELANRAPQLRSPMVVRAVDDYLAGSRWPLDLIQDLAIDQLYRRAAVL